MCYIANTAQWLANTILISLWNCSNQPPLTILAQTIVTWIISHRQDPSILRLQDRRACPPLAYLRHVPFFKRQG